MAPDTMFEIFDTQPSGRAFWECYLDEKSHEPVMASLVLDRPAYRDKTRTLNFGRRFWVDYTIGEAIANQALYRGESQLQGPPMHRDELCYENRMLLTFGSLVQTDCQYMNPSDGFLLFSILFDVYSHCLGSVDDSLNTRRSFAMMALAGYEVGITEQLRSPFQTGYLNRRGSCVLLMVLNDAAHRFGILLAANAAKPCWKNANGYGTGLRLFLCACYATHATTLQISIITGRISLMTIGIKTWTQRSRKQAFKIEHEGFITNLIILLAVLRVGRVYDVERCLFVRLSPSPLPSYQENAFASLILHGANESRWSYYGFIDDFYEGQGCDEGTQKVGGSSEEREQDHRESKQPLQRPSTWPSHSRRKRSANSEGHPEDNDDNGSNERNPHKKRRLEAEKDTRFACPFFKHNPTKFIDERSCCGPGWTNVQRVKEHIFRKHGPPEFQCSRCFADFESHSRLEKHRRNKVACEVRDRPSSPPHVDEGTMQLLKQRKKSTNPLTEIDKWYTVYKIIFPHETQVPSPYYELNEKGLTSPSEATAREMFLENLKETLPLEALTNTGLIDLIMTGAMSAFKKTFSALHDRKTILPSDATGRRRSTRTASSPENTEPYRAEESPFLQDDNDARLSQVGLDTSLYPVMASNHAPRHFDFEGRFSFPWAAANLATTDTTNISDTAPAPEAVHQITIQEPPVVHKSDQARSISIGANQASTGCYTGIPGCASGSSRAADRSISTIDPWSVPYYPINYGQTFLDLTVNDFEGKWPYEE
ncbi:hypothetical protein QX201_002630 [Fusarium graminearum]